jgi:hypothetical protein
MPKFKNVSGSDLDVPVGYGVQRVKDGDTLEVDDGPVADGLAVQVGEPGSHWAAVGAPAKAAVKHAHENDDDTDNKGN